MKITVALPSYNKEKYIERALESILHEKDYVDTILLVDNQSTDKTFELAKKFEPSVHCVQNETNLGMSGNWNRCIDLCETEWLMIFHADDEMVPGAMRHYRKLIEKYPTLGLIYANSYSMTETDESTKVRHSIVQKEFWKAGVEAMSCKSGACSAIMVRKDAYKELGYFIDKSLSSDVEMWHRIASKYDVGFVDEATVIFRVNASSTGVDSLTHREIKDIKADWDLLDSQMASHYPTKQLRDAFLLDCFKRAPGSYFAITKANIRAHNYKKVLQTIWLIIFTYNGLIPLMKMIFAIIKKKITNSIK